MDVGALFSWRTSQNLLSRSLCRRGKDICPPAGRGIQRNGLAGASSCQSSPRGSHSVTTSAARREPLPLSILAGLVVLLSVHAWARAADNVRVSTVWRGAEAEGRTLWVNEQSVALRVDDRTELQVGWQRFVAKGRVRTNRFSTSARWFSAERVLRSEGDRQLVLLLRRLEGSEGTADVAEGVFTYVPPRIDTTSLVFRQRSHGGGIGYRLCYSRTHAGTEASDTIGLSVSTAPVRTTRWQVQMEGAIYADRHRNTTYRPLLSGTINFPLASGWRLQLGITLAPRGFPVAGTPLEALTAFALHRPGSLVESWRDRPTGYLSLLISMGR